MSARYTDPESKFWEKVGDRADPGSCWLWEAALTSSGYGKCKPSKGLRVHSWAAHRVAYMLLIGPIPNDRPHLDHLCRVRNCVNPGHLEPVTLVENLRRGWAQITQCPQGHPYDEINTFRKGNSRACRTCHRDRERIRRRTLHEHGPGK